MPWPETYSSLNPATFPSNQESNEFLSDCSSEELKAKVKQNEEKIKQHEEKFKQYDEEINELKQLLLILLPSDKKQMVQKHFDKRENSAPAKNSTRNDDFSSNNENRTMDKDNVSYLLNLTFLFMNQYLDLKASRIIYL